MSRIEDVRAFEAGLLKFVENSHPGLLEKIREKKTLNEEITSDLKQILADFKETWNERAAAVTGTAAQTVSAGV
jgi:F0F1-type ATP synthase alpha subunit